LDYTCWWGLEGGKGAGGPLTKELLACMQRTKRRGAQKPNDKPGKNGECKEGRLLLLLFT